MSKKIIFTLNPLAKGGTKAEAIGFKGNVCSVAIRKLLANMKGTTMVGEPDKQPEFYATETETQKETG